MADSKSTKLSIIIATVDQATAKIKAINDRLDAVSKPTRDFRKALSDLGEKSGLSGVVDGFKGVGSALEGLLTKLAIVGGVAGLAVHALVGLVEQYDDLGKKANRLGVGVDFLASMRDAAERTGVPLDALDEGLTAFNQNLGQARANTGRMAKFLGIVSPALLKQVKAAKSNAEAFDLMADAMAKVQDPAKRAALAQKVFGDSALAPLLAKGSKGVEELRAHYLELAGSQQDAVDASTKTGEAMHDLHAATDGVKAALVTGLAPALTDITQRLTKWLTGHRAEIAEWVKNIGEKIPGAIQSVVEWLGKAYDKVASFVGAVGGLGNVAIGAAAILAGPLLLSLGRLAFGLGGVLSKLTEVGTALEAGGGKAALFGTSLKALSGIASGVAIAGILNELTGGSIEGGPLAMAQRYIDSQKRASGPDPTLRAALGGNVRAALGGTSSSAKISVDFANVPPNAKVKVDPQSTADIDLSVGNQMLPGLM